MDPHPFPDFPVDVVRHILELASFWDPSMARQLVLVSKDVRQWIDPLLYLVVELARDKHCGLFARTIKSRPHFIAKNVKVLCLRRHGLALPYVEYILRHCTAVQSLAILDAPDKAASKRIRALENLHYLTLSSRVVDFTCIPSQVSHLEIAYPTDENIPILQSILRTSPNLTHLLIVDDDWFPALESTENDLEASDFVNMLKKLLSAALPSLQALIVTAEGDWYPGAELKEPFSEKDTAELQNFFAMIFSAVGDSPNRFIYLYNDTSIPVYDIPGVGWYGSQEPTSWLETQCDMWDEVDRVCQRRLLPTDKTRLDTSRFTKLIRSLVRKVLDRLSSSNI